MNKVRENFYNCTNSAQFSHRKRLGKVQVKLSRLGVEKNANRSGIVLMVTLVLLVVLSTLGYTLSSRIAAQRHRDFYIIDYQAARYGCDSALKYAFAVLSDINTPELVFRSEEPDFSDLFALSELEYQEFLAQWAEEQMLEQDDFDINPDLDNLLALFDNPDNNDFNNIDVTPYFDDPNIVMVRGPYGPTWPFIAEPTELEIGTATVKIEIEDENAKYPIGWAMLDDEEIQREAQAGFETFCEWMGVDPVQVELLKEQMEQINEIRPFTLDLKPITITKKVPLKTTRRTGRSRSRRRRTPRTKPTKKTIPVAAQIANFAKLFHSSMIDTDELARPTIISETRKESALKYIGMWGSRKVNINTAPRHVLEAAFTFGGDAKEIADEIIERRRIEPFMDFEDLRKTLFRYADSLEKCEKCITTTSTFFTIKVTAVRGVAKASAVIAVMKEKGKWQRIAVFSG
jgi:hypothetical protein